MRRTQRLDDSILWAGLMRRLQSLLQHRLGIGRCRRRRICRAKFLAQGAFDKLSRRTQPAIEKDRAGHGFENTSQQSSLATAAAFFFAAPKTHVLAESQFH